MKISIRNLIRKLVSQQPQLITGLILFFVLSGFQSFAQEYATSQTNSHIDESITIAFITTTAEGSVTNAPNAVGTANGDFATLNSEGIVVTGVATLTGKAILTLNMPTEIAAGKHSFVRIDAPTTTGGITLELGQLANLIGLLKNNTIRVTTDAGTAQSNLVRDASGLLYIQVTSSSPYNDITITLDLEGISGLLGVAVATLSMNVYHAVTYENGAFSPCESIPFAFAGVDPNATGIEITLNDALQNPERAIDGIINEDNYALLQNGNVGAVSEVSATVYLGKTVPGTNEVVATISKIGLLVDADILATITIQAFNGATPAGSAQPISSLLLGVRLLDFEADQLASFSYVPGSSFDRIVITSTGVADVLSALRIHELGSRPPITFTGGRLASTLAAVDYSKNISTATATSTPIVLPGFSIICGPSTNYTYELFQVSIPSGRTLAGTLPTSFALSPTGVLTGKAPATEVGTYTFEVRASNIFGQSSIATFVITIDVNLPVTLVSLTAVKEGLTSQLNWVTSEETNSERFDIERSRKGKEWSVIGSVLSHRESSIQQQYKFSDISPLGGENIYRLKMIDLDGTFSYSSLVSLNFTVGNLGLYPNPVVNSESLKLDIADWSKVKMVKIFNALGKSVFESTSILRSGINTDNLVAGLYVVQVIHTNGAVTAHKFVRQ